jgi:hypothetical protein
MHCTRSGPGGRTVTGSGGDTMRHGGAASSASWSGSSAVPARRAIRDIPPTPGLPWAPSPSRRVTAPTQ